MFFTLDNLIIKAKSASKNIDDELLPHIAKISNLSPNDIKSYKIIKRSIDARQKPDVKILYKIIAETNAKINNDFPPATALEPPIWQPNCTKSLQGRDIIIVGAGPAGLFAALTIALSGGHPVVVEQGKKVQERKQDIENFICTRKLNCQSNYLFGEGGAGTWSDGKLFTRVNDARISFVLQEMISCGAPPQIGYFAHPHIGSDLLPDIIAKLREHIIQLGGEFHWNTKMSAPFVANGRCQGIILTDGTILKSDYVIVACGHSSRGLILSLINAGVAWQQKGFQLGMRIEHPQEYINEIQYGTRASYPALGAAEYNIVSKGTADGNIAGVTSFCMCPGGEIIPACSEEFQFCSNGMSNSGRDSAFANSALIATIPPQRFGSTPEAPLDFVANLERLGFQAGGNDYSAPAQSALDFIAGKNIFLPRQTSYRLGLMPARLDKILPAEISAAIKFALRHFDKIHHGFCQNGTFIGIETRVSSPIRFLRNPETLCSSIPNLYLAGEGAGMAGGITSAAVDGIKIAEHLAL